MQQNRYTAYTGPQQDWPVATKAVVRIVNPKDAVPIYDGAPPKPYEVVGLIQVSCDNIVHHAVAAAEAAGADAIVVCRDPLFSAAGLRTRLDLRGKHNDKLDFLQGILIRWK